MAESERLPEYKYGQAPENLRTRKQLAEQGLRPGGPQVAWLVWGSRRRPQSAALFDQAAATPKRVISDKQRAALEAAQRARRTCRVCSVDQGHVLTGGVCFDCPERERKAELQRRARNLLAKDPLILDTETTDLDGYLVQIAVINAAGEVLLDTLVNPQCDISPEAQAVHGITAEMMVAAPTFAELEPERQRLLSGRRVCVYNADFDRGILFNECRRLHPEAGYGATWLPRVEWRCLMVRYAEWVGEWSDYWGGYRWQPLPGGDHSAVGDCRAALAVLREIAGVDEPGGGKQASVSQHD